MGQVNDEVANELYLVLHRKKSRLQHDIGKLVLDFESKTCLMVKSVRIKREHINLGTGHLAVTELMSVQVRIEL